MNLSLSMIIALTALGQAPAETADAKFVQSFFQMNCVRCHNATTKKGKFELHDLKPDVGADRTRYAAILEQLRAGDMPPEKEPQPDLDTLRKVADLIQMGLGGKPVDPVMKPAEVAIRPSEGNRLPHSELFSSKPGPSVPPPPRLWRFSPEGYTVGFSRSLGISPKSFSQPFALQSDPGIKDYASLYWIDDGGTDILMRNAEKIVAALTDQMKKGQDYKSRHHDFLALVDPAKAPSRQEMEVAIRSIYRMVLVREPSAMEIEGLVALHKKCSVPPGDLPSAGRTMLMAPLLSPEALHRFELGRGAVVRPGVSMLSPDELAFALSLAFSGEREPGLFEAAKNGGLRTREDVAKHVRRILDDSKIYKPRLLGFFHEYFGYDRAPEVCKDAEPGYFHHADQLVLDTDLLVMAILQRDKDVLKELLTTPKSFVNGAGIKFDNAFRNPGRLKLSNLLEQHLGSKLSFYATDNPASGGLWGRDVRKKFRNLAQTETAYGFKEWPANQPVDLPGDRIGILMQPSWLVAWSSNFFNDPIRRGLWIREHLLGGEVPSVPVGVVIVLPDDPKRTLRDRLKITRDAACWKCHQKIDDLGLPFEAFDHFGRPQTQEKSVDYKALQETKNRIVHQLPLDTTGMIYSSGDPKLDGPVKNAQEMIRRLAESDRVRQVFIRYVFRYFMGRNETVGDAATLQEADNIYVKSGGSFKALVVSLLTSEAFLYRAVTVQPNRQIQLNKQATNSPAKPTR